jgi:hypothetical protein
MPTPHVIAILCSDLHLSIKAPVARSEEPNWFDAMKKQLRVLQKAHREHNEAPIVCAGDVFDRWNSPPELVNFALDWLPRMFAVPGQHDLPYHSEKDVHRSAYGTLVKAGRITPLHWKGTSVEDRRGRTSFIAYGFPWGSPILPAPERVDSTTKLAVVHQYVWKEGFGYTGASDENHVRSTSLVADLEGYQAALFGDNHLGFLARAGKCHVLNHGGFMRRRVDEKSYVPHYGLLMSDGTIVRKPYGTEGEKFSPAFINSSRVFLQELEGLGNGEADFEDAVERYFNTYEVSEPARTLIKDALNKLTKK